MLPLGGTVNMMDWFQSVRRSGDQQVATNPPPDEVSRGFVQDHLLTLAEEEQLIEHSLCECLDVVVTFAEDVAIELHSANQEHHSTTIELRAGAFAESFTQTFGSDRKFKRFMRQIFGQEFQHQADFLG